MKLVEQGNGVKIEEMRQGVIAEYERRLGSEVKRVTDI